MLLTKYTFDQLIKQGCINLYKLGQYEVAIKDFSQAISKNPKSAIAYLYRGTAKGALGLFYESIKDITSAIEMDYFLTNAYLNRGVSRVRILQYDLATEDFTHVIAVDPHHYEAY